MLLNAIDTTSGDRVAVLLHGMMGSAESWHRVIPLLVARGFRVLALDLPGHGLSPRDPHGSVDSAAASVVETVEALAPGMPVVALGHSYGGTVLAAAADALHPELAVHVDAAAFSTDGAADREELREHYDRERRERTAKRLRETRSYYSDDDVEVEARAAERFDPDTMAAIECGEAGSWSPRTGAIVLCAEPSKWVSAYELRALHARNVEVRRIPGAEHTIWYSHFEEFCAALPELFGDES